MTTSHPSGNPLPPPRSLEAIIRSAGDYVVVSDDLRPETMEAALECQCITATKRRVGGLTLGIGLFLLLFVPLLRSSNIADSSPISPSAAEIHQAALRYAADANISSDWALHKVFDDLRRSQAERFRQSLR